VRFVSETESYEPISELYDRIRPQHPGMFSRSEGWWKHRRLADPDDRRKGSGCLNRVVLDLDGRPEAYALYRVNQALERGVSTGHVAVIEAMGTTPLATHEIWRYLLEIDWVSRLRAYQLPVDHPLLFWLARPRLMGMHLADALWTRLVDVRAALTARTLADAPPVVMAVRDAFCPWNDGRYSVSAGSVGRTDASPDLALDVTALGSVYLGGFSFRQLEQAGRAIALSRGAAARADALFVPGRAPWCPEVF
jgi:predicted acetyltransferase